MHLPGCAGLKSGRGMVTQTSLQQSSSFVHILKNLPHLRSLDSGEGTDDTMPARLTRSRKVRRTSFMVAMVMLNFVPRIIDSQIGGGYRKIDLITAVRNIEGTAFWEGHSST